LDADERRRGKPDKGRIMMELRGSNKTDLSLSRQVGRNHRQCEAVGRLDV
jgi:hypothetical protein